MKKVTNNAIDKTYKLSLIPITNSITYKILYLDEIFALSIEEKTWKELKNSTSIGMMIDESTDITCESYMIIQYMLKS